MQSSCDSNGAHDCAHAVALSRLLDADDVDAALDAGLMDFVPCASCSRDSTATVVEHQQRLANAWAARDRYFARETRLARRASMRDARRTLFNVEKKSALPPAVAAILARAKAKATGRGAQ